jgi:hypothetical protein
MKVITIHFKKYFIPLVLLNLVIVTHACKNKLTSSDEDAQTDGKFRFVLYDGLSNNIIYPIQKKLEENANRIMTDLKLQDIDTCTVHIWSNNETYLAAQERLIGQRYPGSTGYILGPYAIALLCVDHIEDIAVHEYVHSLSLLVQSNFANNPRWLWEAIAQYESGGFVDPKSIGYLVSGNYPTINELNADFNTGTRKIYEVGYLLIEFMKQEWGMDKVIELIKHTGDIQGVLNISVAEYEIRWKQFVDAKYFFRQLLMGK